MYCDVLDVTVAKGSKCVFFNSTDALWLLSDSCIPAGTNWIIQAAATKGAGVQPQLVATAALPAGIPCPQDGVTWETWENTGRWKYWLFSILSVTRDDVSQWKVRREDFTRQTAPVRCNTEFLVLREKQLLWHLSSVMVRLAAELPLKSWSVSVYCLWYQQDFQSLVWIRSLPPAPVSAVRVCTGTLTITRWL